MILNTDQYYADFLDTFLAVIQDKKAKNAATLASGFLRSTHIALTVEKLGHDNSYIPISAVIKAGLVDEQGFILPKTNPRAKRAGLFFDQVRTLAALNQLSIPKEQFSEIQQIFFVTCCQEAINRMLTSSLGVFVENAANITNPMQQATILTLLKQIAIIAFGKTANAIKFNPGSTSLSPESILLIKRQKMLLQKMADDNSGIAIPDEELIAVSNERERGLSSHYRITILDELIPCLAMDPLFLTETEQKEHQAKFNLLKLHCSILSMTINDSWQVKAQWLKAGHPFDMGDTTVILPYSISTILKVIDVTHAKKHLADYSSALAEIQTIARKNHHDWYRWVRNQLPLISSSPAVKELLDSVLGIDLEQPPITDNAISTKSFFKAWVLYLEKIIYYGLSFFALEDTGEFKGNNDSQNTNTP
ncbi:MAG: hypothetical protein PSV35_05125 [bacterium]|nr:hypothetical protein [bacterium]